MLSLILAAHALTLDAPSFKKEYLGVDFFEWLTNSLLVTAIIAIVVLAWARESTKGASVIPGRAQNLFEAIFSALYDTVEGIVGKHMVHRCFSLLATLFIFILFANWFSLLPGVGSIGWGEMEDNHFVVEVPLLRPTTADLNMTLAMALIFMCFWLYWTISEIGVGGFISHTFGVKGGLTGLTAKLLLPVFIFVGIIEIISMGFRPVSLSLRLFGNVFAGENLLTTMITLGKQLGTPDWVAGVMSVIVPIPFYFLELLVGVLQAMVFTLLCAVYIQLSTSHDEEEAH